MSDEIIQKSKDKLKLYDAISTEVSLDETNLFNANSTLHLLVLCTAKRYHDAVGK